MSSCEWISEGSRLSSEMYRWHFHLILPIMPEKQFMNLIMLCEQPLPGDCFISADFKAPPRGRELICISKKPSLCLDQCPIVHIDPCFYAENT